MGSATEDDFAEQENYVHGEEEWHGSSDDNFKVVIRVRPPLPRELRGYKPYQCTSLVDNSHTTITLSENLAAVLNNGVASDGLLYATYRFTFDFVYDQDSTQEEVYEHSARPAVLSTLQGYNAAIIAYGQTGTGKTYTMEGDLEGPQRGIIPRTVEDIFYCIENDPEPTSKYLVRASYLQIYNEVISDLLKPDRTNLIIREDRKRGVFVDGLSEWVVRSPFEVYQLMARGAEERATGSTKMNEVSSRSHAVFLFIVEKCVTNCAEERELAGWSTSGRDRGQSIRVGKLNLVDLAGSERVHITGATGKRLEESKKINASLSALGNVIAALTDPKERQHIPYRDSKLTRILEDSLGGNCKTTMMCMVSPSLDAFSESLSTLKFANRAKNIRNQATVNEDLDQRTLLRKYEKELKKLRSELQRRARELVDKRHLLEVEEQKKRAEADKLAALTALEKRSKEFMKEKEDKKALERKIQQMQSQLLMGGNKLEDVPAVRAVIAQEHKKIAHEYETRLRELEAERHAVEEDLAQVDKYKTLLLKQRDIMIALTTRLNERDEQIVTLQEELEAYDKQLRKLEDALDQKTAELIALRKAAVEHAAVSPIKSTPLGKALGDWGGLNSSISIRGRAQEDEAMGRDGGTDKPLLAQRENLVEVSALLGSTPPAVTPITTQGGSSVKVPAEGASEVVVHDLMRRLELKEEQCRSLEEVKQKLQSDVMRLQEEAGGHVSPHDKDLTLMMKEQLKGHLKERIALKTILESKVLPLADDLMKSLAETSTTDSKANKQAVALQRLLLATISAMSKAQ